MDEVGHEDGKEERAAKEVEGVDGEGWEEDECAAYGRPAQLSYTQPIGKYPKLSKCSLGRMPVVDQK